MHMIVHALHTHIYHSVVYGDKVLVIFMCVRACVCICLYVCVCPCMCVLVLPKAPCRGVK